VIKHGLEYVMPMLSSRLDGPDGQHCQQFPFSDTNTTDRLGRNGTGGHATLFKMQNEMGTDDGILNVIHVKDKRCTPDWSQ